LIERVSAVGAGPQTVGYGFSGVVSGLVGVLVASTVATVADWYGRQAALTSTAALVSAGSAGVLLTSGEIDPGPIKLLVGGIAVILLAVLGTRLVIRWWYHPRRDHNRVVLIGTCSIVASVMLVALFRLEAAVAPRVVDLLAHATGAVAGLSLTVLYALYWEY